MQYTAVIQKSKNWYIGWVEEVPGVNSQGKTPKEVKKNLKEALVMMLEFNREMCEKNRPKGRITRSRIAVAM